MSTVYKIAGVQMDVTFADRAANLKRIESRWEETRRNGAHLTVFPECALTGYCFASLEEAPSTRGNDSGPKHAAAYAGGTTDWRLRGHRYIGGRWRPSLQRLHVDRAGRSGGELS